MTYLAICLLVLMIKEPAKLLMCTTQLLELRLAGAVVDLVDLVAIVALSPLGSVVGIS